MKRAGYIRGLRLGIGLAAMLGLALLVIPEIHWPDAPAVYAASSFHYVFPAIETVSSLPYIERLKYAETVESAVNGRVACDLGDDEYLKLRPEPNTDLVRLEEEITGETRILNLAVRGKTPKGTHSMHLTDFKCAPISMGLGRCLKLSLTKFGAALSDHWDKCHVTGKVCQDQ